jgi:putative ABC transport system substrate-binding protein
MVNDTKDFDTALSTAVRDRVSALIVQPIFGYGETLRVIVKLTHKYRLPSISDFPEFASAGGLLSYGPHRREAVQRVATYIDTILKGAKPATLPIQEPTTFELVINLTTAKALGLTIPPSLLLRADQVIE